MHMTSVAIAILIMSFAVMSFLTPAKESAATVLERELEVLYRVARRMTGNDTDAEDIVSQTLLNAYKNWDSFDGRHPRSWLIRILNNEWLYMLRKR